MGSIPTHGASFRIVTANFKAKLFGCLATKAILFYFVPGLCNGSTTDFDSVSLGSIPSPGAIVFISLKCYLVASAVWGRVVKVRILVGRPSLLPFYP